MKDVAIVIPARYKSSRLPGKPLIKINKKQMILRVADVCNKIIDKNAIYIATDNSQIQQLCLKNKFQVKRINKFCSTGTDRVYLASKNINKKIIINVQGDEPTIEADDIKKIIKEKKKFPNAVICGYTKVKYYIAKNKNIPKVVIAKNKKLIYMSRSLIPGSKKLKKNHSFLKQVCIYAFSPIHLKKFYGFKKKSVSEISEDIEILRFLELGITVQMVEVGNTSIAVDVKSDIKKVEKYLRKNERN